MIPYINPIDLVGMATVKDKGRQYFEPIRSLYVRVTDVDVVLQCVSMVTKMVCGCYGNSMVNCCI